jgi:hypothetical protein
MLEQYLAGSCRSALAHSFLCVVFVALSIRTCERCLKLETLAWLYNQLVQV